MKLRKNAFFYFATLVFLLCVLFAIVCVFQRLGAGQEYPYLPKGLWLLGVLGLILILLGISALWSRLNVSDRLRRFPDQQRPSSSEGVHVMTMHVCKGLEFDRVYLPALNEGIIPGRRCKEPEDCEEERRLLYVAMTRAKDHLELLYVTGSRDNPRPPSRFLSVYGVRNFVSS